MLRITLRDKLLLGLKSAPLSRILTACKLANEGGLVVTLKELKTLGMNKRDPVQVVKAALRLRHCSKVEFKQLMAYSLVGVQMEEVVSDFKNNPELDPDTYLLWKSTVYLNGKLNLSIETET